MKKLVLAVAVAVVLIGGLLGAVASAADGESITVTPSSGGVGTEVTIRGEGWASGVAVKIDMGGFGDPFRLGYATPNPSGRFTYSFTMTASEVGPHAITAQQDEAVATGVFTLTDTTPLDERIWGMLERIKGELDTVSSSCLSVESMLEDPAYGLQEIKAELLELEYLLNKSPYALVWIKAEIQAVESMLNDPAYGLEEIKAEIGGLEAELVGVPRMETLSGESNYLGEFSDLLIVEQTYPSVRHVSLTISPWWYGWDLDANIYVRAELAGHKVFSRIWEGHPDAEEANASENLQFDADYWKITMSNGGVRDIGVTYAATVTYLVS